MRMSDPFLIVNGVCRGGSVRVRLWSRGCGGLYHVDRGERSRVTWAVKLLVVGGGLQVEHARHARDDSQIGKRFDGFQVCEDQHEHVELGFDVVEGEDEHADVAGLEKKSKENDVAHGWRVRPLWSYQVVRV